MKQSPPTEAQGTGERIAGSGDLPQARHLFGDVMMMLGQVRQHDRLEGAAAEGAEANSKPKKLSAEAMLDLAVLKDVASGKW